MHRSFEPLRKRNTTRPRRAKGKLKHALLGRGFGRENWAGLGRTPGLLGATNLGKLFFEPRSAWTLPSRLPLFATLFIDTYIHQVTALQSLSQPSLALPPPHSLSRLIKLLLVAPQYFPILYPALPRIQVSIISATWYPRRSLLSTWRCGTIALDGYFNRLHSPLSFFLYTHVSSNMAPTYSNDDKDTTSLKENASLEAAMGIDPVLEKRTM